MSVNFIILTGIPGCGKSTVLQEALKLSPEATIINFGDAILQEGSSLGMSRDQLRKLPIQQQQEVGHAAAKKFAVQSAGTFILDTHALIKTPTGFCPGVPNHILQLLRPKALVMVESGSSLIYERRKLDATRIRDAESIEEIEYHQSLNRGFMAACCAITGAPLISINNSGTLTAAAKQLSDTIKSFSK
jgi:adenylate kinase